MRTRSLLFATLFLVFGLACRFQVGVNPLRGAPAELNRRPQFLARWISPTPTASLTPTPSSTPSPSPTPTQTATPTIAPTASAEQLRVFEELWNTVNENYLYPDFNGLDWGAVFEEYQAVIETGLYPDHFYSLMGEMIAELNDDHSIYLSPLEAEDEDTEFAGENDYVGIGILSDTIPERKRIVIIVVFSGSPAERAGIHPHDSILAVNGHPIIDETGFRRDLLRGPEGSVVELTVQSPGQEPRSINVTRARVRGGLPVPYEEITSPNGKRIGYILLPTFADNTVDARFSVALRALTEAGPLDGLVIDNRQNNGGADNVTRDVLAYFTSGVMGYFVDRHGIERPFRVLGSEISGSSSIPLAVLVGPNTVSFGEIFAGILQDIRRAVLIGEPTLGNVELLWGYEFEDSSRAWIAQETFLPINDSSTNWEETGIIPDIVAPSNWDEITLDNDPAVQAAIDYFDAQ